jgi:hypothetical protein
MNTGLITARTTEMSPRFQARLAGAIAWIATTSAFAIFVRAKLVVSGDAAATAHNILTHELLYRLGFLGDVLALLYILYTLLLYSFLDRCFNANQKRPTFGSPLLAKSGPALARAKCGFLGSALGSSSLSPCGSSAITERAKQTAMRRRKNHSLTVGHSWLAVPGLFLDSV